MLITVEPDGPVPLYQQIRDRVVEAIAAGQAATGSPLPSTRQLAMDLGINFHTVNKSYDMLRQEGLVRVGRKSGAVVRRDPDSGRPEDAFVEEWSARLRTLLAEAVAQGLPAEELLELCAALVGGFAHAGRDGNTENGTSR